TPARGRLLAPASNCSFHPKSVDCTMPCAWQISATDFAAQMPEDLPSGSGSRNLHPVPRSEEHLAFDGSRVLRQLLERPAEILGVCAVDPTRSSWYTVVRDEAPAARPARS